MKIHFRLSWLKAGSPVQKAFKSAGTRELFTDYVRRIQPFEPCEASGNYTRTFAREPRTQVWVCQKRIAAKCLSSEDLASILGKVRDDGTQELQIVIGGPDGLSEKDLERWQPDMRWSFGTLTLPHELAAVVAAEQIYRAHTILSGLPYHCGH